MMYKQLWINKEAADLFRVVCEYFPHIIKNSLLRDFYSFRAFNGETSTNHLFTNDLSPRPSGLYCVLYIYIFKHVLRGSHFFHYPNAGTASIQKMAHRWVCEKTWKTRSVWSCSRATNLVMFYDANIRVGVVYLQYIMVNWQVVYWVCGKIFI